MAVFLNSRIVDFTISSRTYRRNVLTCVTQQQYILRFRSYWNSRNILFPQVSYSAGSPRLSDKTRYPKFFRINSAETKFNEAIVALLKRFQWSRVAVVKQDQGIFNDVSEDPEQCTLEQWKGREGGGVGRTCEIPIPRPHCLPCLLFKQ